VSRWREEWPLSEWKGGTVQGRKELVATVKGWRKGLSMCRVDGKGLPLRKDGKKVAPA
jgi:hypothetical protein